LNQGWINIAKNVGTMSEFLTQWQETAHTTLALFIWLFRFSCLAT